MSYKTSYLEAISQKDPVAASGWGNRSVYEMLIMLNHIQNTLELNKNDHVLDIGCGSGLFSIGLSAQCNSIYATDFIPEMVEYASELCSPIKNITVKELNILSIQTFLNEVKIKQFDKILMNGVLQAMQDGEKNIEVLNNLYHLLKPGGIALVGSNADNEFKQKYIEGYYKLNLSQSELESKIAYQKKALWMDRQALLKSAEEIGFKVKIQNMPKQFWASWYMFDLVLYKE